MIPDSPQGEQASEQPLRPPGPGPAPGVCPDSVRCVSGRLFLENSQLEHSEDQSSILGQGGSGTVIYRARYQGQPVAVKRFQIKKFKNFANAPAGNSLCIACFQTEPRATSQSPEATGLGGRRAVGEAILRPGDSRFVPGRTWDRPGGQVEGVLQFAFGDCSPAQT